METLRVRLFPLPNVVFFPHTRLPLHIFEPRYRQLMRDALADDRHMAVALLQPGWDDDYYGNPPVYPVCCLGIVEDFQALEDGRFNLTLAGLRRIRILDMISPKPYRTVTAVPAPESNPDVPANQKLRGQILELAEAFVGSMGPARTGMPELNGLDFEGMVNTLATQLNLPTSHKQQLLEMDDLGERGLHVARFLQLQIRERELIQSFRHLSPDNPQMN